MAGGWTGSRARLVSRNLWTWEECVMRHIGMIRRGAMALSLAVVVATAGCSSGGDSCNECSRDSDCPGDETCETTNLGECCFG